MNPQISSSAIAGIIMMLMFLGALLGLMVFWGWMLVDCIKNKNIGESEKPLWIIIVLFGSWAGAIIYFVAKKRKSAKIKINKDTFPSSEAKIKKQNPRMEEQKTRINKNQKKEAKTKEKEHSEKRINAAEFIIKILNFRMKKLRRIRQKGSDYERQKPIIIDMSTGTPEKESDERWMGTKIE